MAKRGHKAVKIAQLHYLLLVFLTALTFTFQEGNQMLLIFGWERKRL
jgi:hypothetical protein